MIQEQHPDRCRLYLQWQGIGWPILHDPIDKMRVRAVPHFVAIDEYGIVRSTNANGREFDVEEDFINMIFEAPTTPVPMVPAKLPYLADTRKKAREAKTSTGWAEHGDALILDADPKNFTEAIDAYTRAVRLDPQNEQAHFGLGVAKRMRYDLGDRQGDDFQGAVDAWHGALNVNPNHYIYRRRIQQYGPRLDKPYNFYDWISTARKELTERGEHPFPLVTEPVGAELTGRGQPSPRAQADIPKGDPDARINRDEGNLIQVEQVFVQGSQGRGSKNAQIHLTFRTNPGPDGHWNNEAEPLRVWIEKPPVGNIKERFLEYPNAPTDISNENRAISFEIELPESGDDFTVKAYALYYCCEGPTGKCVYLRKDIDIKIPMK